MIAAVLVVVGLGLLFWAGFEYALQDFEKLRAIYEIREVGAGEGDVEAPLTAGADDLEVVA